MRIAIRMSGGLVTGIYTNDKILVSAVVTVLDNQDPENTDDCTEVLFPDGHEKVFSTDHDVSYNPEFFINNKGVFDE